MGEDWYDEVYGGQRYGLRVKERLFAGRSDFQKVEVLDTEDFGRVLAIENVFMTSERDEFFYHEMIAHPALVTAPSIERVLIIGGGDGGTAREVLRHPGVRSLVMVEIDPVVIEASREHLPSIGGDAWNDPRLDLRVADGIAYVKETRDPRYDVVILDGTDPIGPGEGLFDEAFYRGVRRVLKPGGVFALQSESPFLTPDLYRAIRAALSAIFPTVRSYFGNVPLYSAGMWSWTYATDTADPSALDAERIAALGPCRYWSPALHRTSFIAPPFVAEL